MMASFRYIKKIENEFSIFFLLLFYALFAEQNTLFILAIAIGTSHGAYKFKGEAKLRFDILAKIKERLPNTPIVLHGASSVIPKFFIKYSSYLCCHS